MHSALTIVRADPSHLADVARLFDAYRVFYTQPSDPARAHAFMQQRLEQGDSVVFLAVREAVACGFVQLYPTFSSVAARRVWTLNDLFVAPACRGAGVGAALLHRAEAHARATGAVRLELSTAADNHDAQRLYERLGWTREAGVYHYARAV